MAESFQALVVDKKDDAQFAEFRQIALEDLPDGEVLVRVAHSTLNYKDGLAVTGAAPVVRKMPLVPGIDLAGTVESSEDGRFTPGDRVILNGYGVGETHSGGYAGFARLKADWLVPLPDSFTTAEAMAIGTAGYTAMLAVMALEAEGISPDRGPVLVTGAAGGVGSVAVALLAHGGFEVVAATGRESESAYLKRLGASEIRPRAELEEKPRPLKSEKWAGVVDVAGSTILANALAETRYGGCVAACGLAAGMDLPTSVAPFILRGVTLKGIDSVMAPMDLRLEAWRRLASELDKSLLAEMTSHAPLSDVPALAADILAGKVRGRVVIDLPDRGD